VGDAVKQFSNEFVEAVARQLWPFDYHDGVDCRGENGRVGQPCRICADQLRTWKMRKAEVLDALNKAAAL
jgi:hypothetical protein